LQTELDSVSRAMGRALAAAEEEDFDFLGAFPEKAALAALAAFAWAALEGPLGARGFGVGTTGACACFRADAAVDARCCRPLDDCRRDLRVAEDGADALATSSTAIAVSIGVTSSGIDACGTGESRNRGASKVGDCDGVDEHERTWFSTTCPSGTNACWLLWWWNFAD